MKKKGLVLHQRALFHVSSSYSYIPIQAIPFQKKILFKLTLFLPALTRFPPKPAFNTSRAVLAYAKLIFQRRFFLWQ